MPPIDKYEQIVTAWAEISEGPGWSNRPVFILLRHTHTGVLRIIDLQPEEQDRVLRMLHGAAARMAELLVKLCEAARAKADEDRAAGGVQRTC